MNVSNSMERYDVRGLSVGVMYDDENHQVTLQHDGLGEHYQISNMNLQDFLRSMGIYTKVWNIIEISQDKITFSLKPSSGIEFRANATGNYKITSRPVTVSFEGTRINKRRDSWGYQCVLGKDLLSKTGLEAGDKLSMYASVGKQGNLRLDGRIDGKPHALTVRVDSTGLVGIPNGLGAAADLDGQGVTWNAPKEGQKLIEGDTTARLDDFDEGGDKLGEKGRTTITGVKQEGVEYKGKKWTQEHFKCYMLEKHVEQFGWEPDTYIDIQLLRDGTELMVCLTDEIRDKFIRFSGNKPTPETVQSKAPCVRKLYTTAQGSQLSFNMPNSLVYALGWENERVVWIPTEHGLCGKLADD